MQPYVRRHIIPAIGEMLGTYNITGEEYDSRKSSLSNLLLMELKSALGLDHAGTGSAGKNKTSGGSAYGYIVNELKPGLSSVAYKHVGLYVYTVYSMTIIGLLVCRYCSR